MIENVKLTDGRQTIEIDRSKTENYVLNTVDLGDRDTSYSTIRTHDIIGLEWGNTWIKRLTPLEITGWVVADDRDAESMALRKMRLNRFVVPQTKFSSLIDGKKTIDFIVTESIRYGKTHQENNEVFCAFQITGLYRQEPPEAPVNFRSTAKSEASITLTWNSQSNLTGYVLEYKKSTESDWTTWTPAPETSANSVMVTGLESSTAYHFRLFARNTHGKSEPATLITLTSPTAPVNLRITELTANSVTLAWDLQGNLTSYTLEYQKMGAFDWAFLVPAPGASATSAAITGLTANTTYVFRLTANGASGFAASLISATTSSF